MFRRDSLSSHQWCRLHERLDRAVAEAARLYLQRLTTHHTNIDPKKWSDELDELRLQREPEYDTPGLPLVYALKYMPRRVVSIVGSLLSILDERYPTSVLDIGSGTGSTALALDLLNLPRHINLLGLEPSREMIAFAECSRHRARVSAHYRQGSIVALGGNDVGLDSFDLLVFSACFPYGFSDWGALSGALSDYDQHKNQMILVVEPDAKSDILDSFERCLKLRGWPTRRLCCHDLPELIKRDDLPLREMVDVWRRLGLQDSTPPRTWWNPPDDKFLIANPQPSWPSPLASMPGLQRQFQAVGVVPVQEHGNAPECVPDGAPLKDPASCCEELL
jgi:SAM-dependent methyltransferase